VVMLKVPMASIASTVSKPLGVKSSAGAKKFPAAPFTRMSNDEGDFARRSSSIVTRLAMYSIASLHCVGLRTSHAYPCTSCCGCCPPPRCVTISRRKLWTASSKNCFRRPHSRTVRHPCRSNCRAISYPIPDPPPVTIAVRPLKQSGWKGDGIGNDDMEDNGDVGAWWQ
jgi:hypothetical protein